jgi:hypothetical protein
MQRIQRSCTPSRGQRRSRATGKAWQSRYRQALIFPLAPTARVPGPSAGSGSTSSSWTRLPWLLATKDTVPAGTDDGSALRLTIVSEPFETPPPHHRPPLVGHSDVHHGPRQGGRTARIHREGVLPRRGSVECATVHNRASTTTAAIIPVTHPLERCQSSPVTMSIGEHFFAADTPLRRSHLWRSVRPTGEVAPLAACQGPPVRS